MIDNLAAVVTSVDIINKIVHTYTCTTLLGIFLLSAIYDVSLIVYSDTEAEHGVILCPACVLLWRLVFFCLAGIIFMVYVLGRY